ncbi:cobalt-precorrin 5A hydrolase [Desulfobacca acetoxidans]
MTKPLLMATGMRPIRVVALTPAGVRLARRLCQTLEGTECWLPASWATAGEHTFDRLTDVFAEAFTNDRDLVCIMATGIVVRQVAPLLQGKDRDPAVVVLDQEGRFAVSLLSGHLGGANELACRVAATLGGTPVITTATDIQGLPALDLLAAQAGLIIENPTGVKEVSMALLAGNPVRLVDPEDRLATVLAGYPHLFHREAALEAALAGSPQPTVYVGCRERSWPTGWLRLRPRSLIAGVGCHRGTPSLEILDHIQEVFRQAGLSLLSLKALATIAAKKDEPGLKEAARRLEVELLWYTAEELEHVPVPHPSAQVTRHVGAKSVSEAAALKAGQGELLIPKHKSANVTVAVARAIWPS